MRKPLFYPKSVLLSICLLFMFGWPGEVCAAWMEGGMKYIKIKVLEDGIYKIPKTQIDAFINQAGENPVTIPQSSFALFHRGKEVPVSFLQNDLVFFGERNDGSLDAQLYPDGGQANPRLNLLSDTGVYFLTWYKDGRLGKRIEQLNNINPPGTRNHYRSTTIGFPDLSYNYGQNFFNNSSAILRYATYQPGEGWVSNSSSNQVSFHIKGLATPISAQGPKPILKLRLNATSRVPAVFDVLVGSSLRTVSQGNSTDPYTPTDFEFEIEISDVEGDSLLVQVDVSGGGLNVAYGSLSYSQSMNFQGDHKRFLEFPQATSTSFRFSPQNFDFSSNPSKALALDVSNIDSLRWLPGFFDNGTSQMVFLIDEAVDDKVVAVWNYDFLLSPVSMDFREYKDLSQLSADYLLIAPVSFSKTAERYTNYRASLEGGSYSALYLDVEEVMDQGSYGEWSPLGIREVLREFYWKDTLIPTQLFLVGKGFIPNAGNGQHFYRFDQSNFSYSNLVPTFGFPGSDVPFSIGFDPSRPQYPVCPVGRLTVSDTTEFGHYLDKIKEYEANENKGLWKKNILHLSGGKTESELGEFLKYVNEFKEIAEGPQIGAQVKTLSKKSSNSTENIVIDSLVNQGLSMITMYGHSSVNFSDIQIGDIDDPNLNYNNRDGKLPMFIINGCYSGRVYENFDSWVGSWVRAKDRGSHLILSQTDFGFNPILKFYTERFYLEAYSYERSFGASVGQVNIRAIESLFEFFGDANPYIISQNQLMALQGDPGIRLLPRLPKSDYTVLDGSFAKPFFGDELSSNMDSFELAIPVANLGRIDSGEVSLEVAWLSPFESEPVQKSFSGISYADTFFITMEVPQGEFIGGLNSFSVSLDPDNLKTEEDTSNNRRVISINIDQKGVRFIYPTPFAVVSDEMLDIHFLFDEEESGELQLEIDTSFLFGQSRSINFSTGGVLYQNGTIDISDYLPLSDTTIFFIRGKGSEDTIWSEISFTYIENADWGWSQASFGQFYKNESLNSLQANGQKRNFEFNSISIDLQASSFGSEIPNGRELSEIKIGGNWILKYGTLQEKDCQTNRLYLIELDGFSGLPVRDLPFLDSRSCGVAPLGVKAFAMSDMIFGDFINYLSTIPEENYLFMMTSGKLRYDEFPVELKDSLEDYGFPPVLWDSMVHGQPFIALTKLGYSEDELLFLTSADAVLPLDSQMLELDFTLSNAFSSGGLISTLVGPATTWKSFEHKIGEPQINETWNATLWGVKSDGVMESIRSFDQSERGSIDTLSAKDYPYLFVENYYSDSIERTPIQPQRWAFSYEPAPDGHVIFLEASPNIDAALVRGSEVVVSLGFVNHGITEFSDSIPVLFSLNEGQSPSQIIISSPDPGDTTFFMYSLQTADLEGANSLNVFVNPFDQLELSYENNSMTLEFEVQVDRISPILRVYFDGFRITNGDLVSSNPEIRLELYDENSFFYPTDSNSIFYELYRVQGFDREQLFLSGNKETFHPADSTSPFALELYPGELDKGTYLLKANGRDAAGNRAGFSFYEVQFEVGGSNMVDDFVLYPNPMSNRLNARFNLSGMAMPRSVRFTLYDSKGQKILDRNLSSKSKLGFNDIQDILDGTSLEAGLYFFRFSVQENEYPVDFSGSPVFGSKRGVGKLIVR